MNFFKNKTNALIAVGVISVIVIICAVFIINMIQTAKEIKIKEFREKTLELNKRLATKKAELDSVKLKLKDFKPLNYYTSINDSLSKIIGSKPTEADMKYAKEKIGEKIYSINWIIKNIPRKRYFTYKKNNGIPLGYWEEEEDANIENVEVEYRMPIEEYLVVEKNNKSDYEKEYREMRDWDKNHNLIDLENKLNKIRSIIEQIKRLSIKIEETKNEIENIQFQLNLK